MRAIAAVLAAAMCAVAAGAQTPEQRPGRVAGQVVDASTGSPVGDASVQIAGSSRGASTSIDGRFSITGVPEGAVSIVVRRLGFAPKTVTGVVVPGGGTVEQNVALRPAAVRLTSEVVTASAERGTVSEALDRQRTAIQIVNSVTAEQITRSPDADAAAAVSRVSGVTVQGGKFVFVRGLGERYTTMSLNGARIPSPEPEKREVPLDIFPSALLQSITTSKTFTPDQPGDFSGADVDLRTRDFPLRRVVSYSTSTGFNSAAGAALPVAPTTGPEWIGLAGSARRLPQDVRTATESPSATQADINRAIRSFRDVWTPRTGGAVPSTGAAISAGGQTPLGGLRLGYVASASYTRSQEVRRDETRALAVPDSRGGTRPYDVFRGQTGSIGVLWGGLLNLSTLLGPRTRIALNNTYNRSADNTASVDAGVREDFSYPTRRSLLDFVERSVRSNQLRVEHSLGESQQLALAVTSSGVRRSEPDRTEVQYVQETDPATGQPLPYALFSFNPDGARKTFGELREDALSGRVDYTLSVLRLGVAARATNRRSDTYSFSILSRNVPYSVREQSPEAIFSGPYVADTANAFYILRNSAGGSYTARDRVSAAYAMLTLSPREWLKIIGGARVEHANLTVTSASVLGGTNVARLNTTDVLPSLALTFALGESHNLRVSASQTLARPEYRELSPITYRDVLAERDIFGNANLKRTLIQNYDTRWEWYPRAGEVVSAGVFAKHFTQPIEQVDVATSGASQISFVNARAANDYGVEGELRLRMDRIARPLAPLTAFTNATVIRSRIDLSGDRLSALTNRVRPMVGQAPYVVNAGATWQSSSGRASGTVLYNIVGKRIVSAGVTPLPDTYEQPRAVLDASLQIPVFARVALKLDGKNLLDSPFEVRQGTVTRNRYRLGRAFGLGLRWQP